MGLIGLIAAMETGLGRDRFFRQWAVDIIMIARAQCRGGSKINFVGCRIFSIFVVNTNFSHL